MNMGYKEQIIQFIMRNARDQGKIGKSETKPKVKAKRLVPIREKKFFRKMNLDGLLAKLLEFNTDLLEAKHENAIP